MIYSCWDPASGLYDYYVDKKEIPVNADLPVPALPAVAGNRIGVAALEAGRPLPGGAKHTGRGWHAKGLVVQCGRRSGMAGFGSMDSAVTWVKEGGWLLLGGAAVLYFVGRAKL